MLLELIFGRDVTTDVEVTVTVTTEVKAVHSPSMSLVEGLKEGRTAWLVLDIEEIRLADDVERGRMVKLMLELDEA